VRDPDLLADTDLTNAFVSQIRPTPGNTDPTGDDDDVSPAAAILDTSILVFRQSLEAILVLAAVTAGLVGKRSTFWKPIGVGAGVGFLATAGTWFLVVALISAIGAPSVRVQAVTEVLAIVVLLVVMNWFFHRIYWTGWISRNTRKQRELVNAASQLGSRTLFGLGVLGFMSVYREGFEVVLFLQNLRIKAGAEVVLDGVLIGLAGSTIIAWLTFVGREHLPYKKMLVYTGVMLGFVMLVMVGGGIRDLQEAYWLSMTHLPLAIPTWLSVWFSVYPTAEGLAAQAVAGGVVIGSYVAASRLHIGRPRSRPVGDLRPQTIPG
jgi:high-affinity iron transporter